ncbi:uncharacterized protein UV8b_00099 [Ustilaginoidea virens]|uniref:Uncharacterized protein n=1 Tax=Ustilaginoidea virens TaxID=1159556 RepID=A0A8E5MDA4_USTVR|nr:uncharacterized protein UV8b_00099 [Ustilaginoidea virens]QUC15858.1 hypothetical protein UV8b_00099 [Ustilaginoidea virens]
MIAPPRVEWSYWAQFLEIQTLRHGGTTLAFGRGTRICRAVSVVAGGPSAPRHGLDGTMALDAALHRQQPLQSQASSEMDGTLRNAVSIRDPRKSPPAGRIP